MAEVIETAAKLVFDAATGRIIVDRAFDPVVAPTG
jgi:hypothetical protein